MARQKTTTEQKPLTTAQQLGSLIKSARDIMRKDKGLNGDLDRLPMLTWVMFLKFLDDSEKVEETRAAHRRQEVQIGHRPAVPLAGLGREERWHHRRRTDRVHQQRRSRTPRWQTGAGSVRLPAGRCRAATATVAAT